MNLFLAGIFGGWEIVLILAVALLLFGSKKLPELAKGLGQGIKEFKKATREVTDEFQNSMEDEHRAPSAPPQRKLPPATTVVDAESSHTVSRTDSTPKV